MPIFPEICRKIFWHYFFISFKIFIPQKWITAREPRCRLATAALLCSELRAGQCFVRDGRTIHRGHPSGAERLTLAGGWSAEMTPSALAEAWARPRVEDVRRAWTHDPAVRDALPTDWMKRAYDRWKPCFRLGSKPTDLLAGWVIESMSRQQA